MDDSKWFDPPNLHEVCSCFDCHDTDEHLNWAEYWAERGCLGCQDLTYLQGD